MRAPVMAISGGQADHRPAARPDAGPGSETVAAALAAAPTAASPGLTRWPPRGPSPAEVLGLQRTVGNRATRQILARLGAAAAPAERSAQPAVGAAERGAAAPHPVGGAIQRYSELQLGDQHWRLADSGRILVRETHGTDQEGEPLPNRSHFLWATPELREQANKELAEAESFIRLQSAGEPKSVKVRGQNATLEEEILIRANQLSQRGAGDEKNHYYQAQDQLLGVEGGGNDRSIPITRILPQYVGPGSGEGAIGKHKTVPSDRLDERPVSLEGEGLTLPSDCNKAARVIMGIMTQNDPLETPPDTKAEVSVTTPGSPKEEKVHGERKEYDLGKFGANTNLVESGGLTALSDSLVAFARSILERRQLESKKSEKSEQQEIDKVLESLLELQGDQSGRAWTVLHDMKAEVPLLYQEFVTWAGIDKAAAPKVGEALVTYRVEGKPSAKFTTNKKAYAAMLEGLTNALSGEQLDTTVERLTTVRNEAQEALRVALASEKDLSEKISEARVSLESHKLGGDENKSSASLSEAKSKAIELSSKIDGYNRSLEAAEKSARLNEAVTIFLAGFLDRLQSKAVNPGELAQEGLVALGITEKTLFPTVMDKLNQAGLGVAYFGGDIDQEVFKKAVTKNDLWNKHWAGIIMTDDSDYVSLENDASTEKLGVLNTAWGFMLYGNAKEKQSFHEQMMESGDFGEFASTLRYRRPIQQDVPERLPKSGTESFWKVVDKKIKGAGANVEALRGILTGEVVILPMGKKKLTQQQLPGLRADYANIVEKKWSQQFDLDEETLKMVVELITKILG